MNIESVDDVRIIELGQLLLSPEGQQTVDECLIRRDKRTAMKILWGAVTSPFLPKTELHSRAYLVLVHHRPWE